VKAAMKFVRAHHRHLPLVQGGLFAVKVIDDAGVILGVAIAGNPGREWQGDNVIISRVATRGAKNCCSMLYGAMCRAAKALAYHEAWTYTLPGEPGTSLRAAGFEDMGLTSKAGDWNCSRRARGAPAQPGRKRRWRRVLNGR
jgi:hypothetical protein